MKKATYIFICLTALLVAACNTSGCLDNQSAIPLAGFYDSATGKSIALSALDVSGVGAPNDSLLLASGTSASQLYLPMRSTKQSTAWCFHYTQEGLDDPANNDTIVFDYTSEPFFASEECGAMYYYNITRMSYTTHLIDSVVITDSLITNVDIERISIYFRTAEAGDEEEEPEQ